MEGRITHHYFPILVNFIDSEPIKSIAIKIFRGLRNIVHRALFLQDPLFITLSETEAYAYAFGGHTLRQYFVDSYDLVLVMRDGMRWKLDSN
jgi:hypothetical protein